MEGEIMERKSREDQNGFTLIEVLVVLFILGLIAALMTIAVSKTLKRQRLGTAAEQLSSFIQKAYTDTSLNQREVFITIGGEESDGSRTVFMIEDSNENGSLDGTDTRLDTLSITHDLVLSNSTTAAVAWPVINGNLIIGCSAGGRMVDPTTDTNVDHYIELTITHREMLTGNLTPRIRYTIRVYPIWKTEKTETRY